jgi:phage shock protein PspC (stress-responsive transcriptional regulator)
MKKVIKVNLGGLQFTFDEDAYDMMINYLNSLTEAFKRENEDAAEIVGDIESRCAEILSEQFDRNNYIVTIADVTALIERMGEPQDIIDSDSDTEAEEAAPSGPIGMPPGMSEQEARNVHRRLYRSEENKMLGGVCGGCASYFNIDVTWIRLALTALVVLSISFTFFRHVIPLSFIFLAYIVMWIVVPLATTPLQKLQQKGEAPSMKNIGNSVMGNYAPSYPTPDKSNKRFADSLVEVISIIAKVLIVIAAIILCPVLIAVVAAMVALIGVSIAIPLGMLQISDTSEATSFVIIAFVALLLTGIPIFALLYTIIRRGANKKPMPGKLRNTLLCVWIAALIALPILINVEMRRQRSLDKEQRIETVMHKLLNNQDTLDPEDAEEMNADMEEMQRDLEEMQNDLKEQQHDLEEQQRDLKEQQRDINSAHNNE